MNSPRTTRDLLLEAAIEIIEARGEGAIRVDQVAERAGFTKPVLYAHFENRDDLIVAAQSRRYTRALELGRADVEQAVERCSNADEFFQVMRQWVLSFGDPEGGRRRRFRIEVLGSAISRQRLQDELRHANRLQARDLGALISAAKERGWLRSNADPQDLAMWWTGLVLSRYIVEMDSGHLDAAAWDAITIDMMRSIIAID